MAEQSESQQYRVVKNHEEQYSLWPVEKAPPPGWSDAGKSGSRSECLDFVEQVWTDMRPLSLRRQMDAVATIACESSDAGVD